MYIHTYISVQQAEGNAQGLPSRLQALGRTRRSAEYDGRALNNNPPHNIWLDFILIYWYDILISYLSRVNLVLWINKEKVKKKCMELEIKPRLFQTRLVCANLRIMTSNNGSETGVKLAAARCRSRISSHQNKTFVVGRCTFFIFQNACEIMPCMLFIFSSVRNALFTYSALVLLS